MTCAFSAKLATKVRKMTGVEMQPLQQESETADDGFGQTVGWIYDDDELPFSELVTRHGRVPTVLCHCWFSRRDGVVLINR